MYLNSLKGYDVVRNPDNKFIYIQTHIMESLESHITRHLRVHTNLSVNRPYLIESYTHIIDWSIGLFGIPPRYAIIRDS